ncbi:MAG: hypothetical protein AB1716_20445 [Planctomycetota bacterium]
MRHGARRVAAGIVGAALLWGAAHVAADLADVYLKSGLVLRGEISTEQDEIVVRNAAGELRLPRAEVERIVPVATQPASGPAETAAAPPAPQSRPATAAVMQPAVTQPAIAEPSKPEDASDEPPLEGPELPTAPLLAELDIQRLKMLELRLDGPAEPVRVRFKRRPRQRELALEVLESARRRSDFRPEFAEVLQRGLPHEKLQVIVRLTGAKHADRVVIEGDPAVFEGFRRRVLPLVNRSCGRAGCHAGRSAQVFRFPQGFSSNEAYAYTAFVLLDQMETEHGPVLERDSPEESVLLNYFLPAHRNPRPHPAVRRGRAFTPVVYSPDERLYQNVLSWVSTLRTPRPAYGLEYKNPYAGRPGQAGAATRPAEQPALPATAPAGAGAAPATAPAGVATMPTQPAREAPAASAPARPG